LRAIEKLVKFWSWSRTYSGIAGYREFATPCRTAAGLRVERGHYARPRLYWYNAQYNVNLFHLYARRTCCVPFSLMCWISI